MFVALADLNHDQILDVVALEWNRDDSPGTVEILMGVGDFTLHSGPIYPVIEGPSAMAIEDFDRDGHLDIAVGSSRNSRVTLLFGDGTGTLDNDDVPFAACANAVALGDFDDDNCLNLATANVDSTVSFYFGYIADHTYSKPSYETAKAGAQVAVGDLDGDGRLDIVTQPLLDNPMTVSFGTSVGFERSNLEVDAI